MNISGQVCVVTGAASGIGLAIVRELVAAKAKVAMCDVDSRSLAAASATLPHDQVLIVKADVSSKEQIEHLVQETESRLGPISVWVNNAGVARHKWITEYTVEEIDWMMDINVKGTILGCQAALRTMATQRRGHILNIVSTASLRGIPTESVYCATKFAVRGFTQGLQEEAGPYGVRVTAILPGGVNTAFWDAARDELPPVERFLSPEHVAKAVRSVIEMDDFCVTRELVLRSLHDADFTLAEKKQP
jgi:NAD(P)-dependent dehydrogenase (short-subunit alcohol dehydrogenase family)